MSDILLTISQALQLVAIAPCVFLIVFLLLSGRHHKDNLIPVLYFASLSCSFMLPLLDLLVEESNRQWFKGALLMGENLTVPLSFLLIIQFLLGRLPPPMYWLILALPVIGGGPFTLALLYADEVCLGAVTCYPTESLRTLYSIFSTLLIILLLVCKLSTSAASIAIEETDRKHKYWLVIALVGLNLVLALLDLMVVAGKLPAGDVLLASTIIRITFIYLVLTSIFVVFYELFEIDEEQESVVQRSQEHDLKLVEKIRGLLEQDKIYREMGLSRRSLAERLAISEHQASRIINAYFRKNFNELINTCRVEEAKQRLAKETVSITVIAFEVGFNSIASFNRVFKELVSTSPTEYRARWQNGEGENSVSGSATARA